MSGFAAFLNGATQGYQAGKPFFDKRKKDKKIKNIAAQGLSKPEQMEAIAGVHMESGDAEKSLAFSDKAKQLKDEGYMDALDSVLSGQDASVVQESFNGIGNMQVNDLQVERYKKKMPGYGEIETARVSGIGKDGKKFYIDDVFGARLRALDVTKQLDVAGGGLDRQARLRQADLRHDTGRYRLARDKAEMPYDLAAKGLRNEGMQLSNSKERAMMPHQVQGAELRNQGAVLNNQGRAISNQRSAALMPHQVAAAGLANDGARLRNQAGVMKNQQAAFAQPYQQRAMVREDTQADAAHSNAMQQNGLDHAFREASTSGNPSLVAGALGSMFPNEDGTPSNVQIQPMQDGRVLVQTGAGKRVFNSLDELRHTALGASRKQQDNSWSKFDDESVINKATGEVRPVAGDAKSGAMPGLGKLLGDDPIAQEIDRALPDASVAEKVRRYKAIAGEDLSDEQESALNAVQGQAQGLLRTEYVNEALGAWKQELADGKVKYKPEGVNTPEHELKVTSDMLSRWAIEAADAGMPLEKHIDSRLREMYTPVARKFQQGKEAASRGIGFYQ